MQTVASRFPGCRIRHMSKRGAQKTGRKEMHGTACQRIAIGLDIVVWRIGRKLRKYKTSAFSGGLD